MDEQHIEPVGMMADRAKEHLRLLGYTVSAEEQEEGKAVIIDAESHEGLALKVIVRNRGMLISRRFFSDAIASANGKRAELLELLNRVNYRSSMVKWSAKTYESEQGVADYGYTFIDTYVFGYDRMSFGIAVSVLMREVAENIDELVSIENLAEKARADRKAKKDGQKQ